MSSEYRRLSDSELVERLVEERAIINHMMSLGFVRRAKEASDQIKEIHEVQKQRELDRERKTETEKIRPEGSDPVV